MKSLLFCLFCCCSFLSLQAQTDHQSNTMAMKLNAGIITENLAATKAFYQEYLGFGVSFENDFFLLMHTPGHEAELAFMLPDHPSQQPMFKAPFQGQGIFITIEVDDVDALYEQVKSRGAEIIVEMRDEPWGDRHFSIRDPNGVGVDLVTYTAPE